MSSEVDGNNPGPHAQVSMPRSSLSSIRSELYMRIAGCQHESL